MHLSLSMEDNDCIVLSSVMPWIESKKHVRLKSGIYGILFNVWDNPLIFVTNTFFFLVPHSNQAY